MNRRPLIYLAGPIRKGCLGHNVRQADAAMHALMMAGVAVINPMLSCYAGHPDPLSGVVPHAHAHGPFREMGAEPWLAMDLELVARSDAVLRLPGESAGADGEVSHALAIGVPVFHDLTAALDYLKAGHTQ